MKIFSYRGYLINLNHIVYINTNDKFIVLSNGEIFDNFTEVEFFLLIERFKKII